MRTIRWITILLMLGTFAQADIRVKWRNNMWNGERFVISHDSYSVSVTMG